MTPSEKHKEEQDKLKNSRMNRILEASFSLFSEKGIDTIAMTDIAKKAEIGVASLYRYFETKEDLAIEVAIYAWNKEDENFKSIYTSEDYKNLNGLEQLKVLMNIFATAMNTQISFFRFIYFFDGYIKKENVNIDRLSKYEHIIENVNNIVLEALTKGEEDGSINYKKSSNPVIAATNRQELHFTIMHTLFSMTQKLALSGSMLYQDRVVSGKQQIDLICNIILNSIS